MAERINRLTVDKYTIEINEGGQIVFNPGDSGSISISGDVDITGSLTTGSTTSIEREDLVIYDNMINLNRGESGPGISIDPTYTEAISGIEIDRGSGANDAFLVFDEGKETILNGGSIDGAFSFRLANGDYVGIHTTSIHSDIGDDLHLKVTSPGVVKIEGNPNYERLIWNYNVDNEVAFIPEPFNGDTRDTLVTAQSVVDYVDGYHLNFFQDKIEEGDTRVETFDTLDKDGNPTGVVTSRVEIAVDDSIFSTFYDTRVEFGNLLVTSDPGDVAVITTNGTNADIRLRGTGTGVVQVDGWQNFTIELDPSSAPSEGVTIYSKTLGDGGTGLYFYNQDGTQDEFVSRNKALLYSIIF